MVGSYDLSFVNMSACLKVMVATALCGGASAVREGLRGRPPRTGLGAFSIRDIQSYLGTSKEPGEPVTCLPCEVRGWKWVAPIWLCLGADAGGPDPRACLDCSGTGVIQTAG